MHAYEDVFVTVIRNAFKILHDEGIIATSPLVSSDYRDKAMELYKKYYPIEVTPTMTIQEKIPHMWVHPYETLSEYFECII